MTGGKKIGKGCCQPAGMQRLEAAKLLGRNEFGAAGEDEWTFEQKLPHHVDVALWLVDNARPDHILQDDFLRLHEHRISGGKYRMPGGRTVSRIQEITEFLTFKNVLDSIVRAFVFQQGVLKFMSLYFDTWTSGSGDTYVSLESSFYDPHNQGGLTNATLWICKLKGSHNSNAMAIAICSVMTKYGMSPAPLPYEPPQTALAKGYLGQHTDISQFVRATTTDDGGGVMKNVAMELNIPRHWCSLHRHDIPHSWALGQSGTDNSRNADMVLTREFMSRMSKMVTHFHGSSQAQDHLKDEAQVQAVSWLQLVHRMSAMLMKDKINNPS